VRSRSSLALVCAALALPACAFAQPDRIHYVWTPEAASAAPAALAPPSGETFVGVALSGGGSRAATFGAAALEALHEHALLSQTTHVSSVSGGGFAAAWYVLNRPDLCAEPSREPGCADAAFADFKAAMRHDFLFDVARRQAFKPNRISSPTRRLSSLAEALDDAYIGGASFAALPASPVLLVNAARLDDGRRFVFSNAVLPDEALGVAPLGDPRLRAASFALPGCPRATPSEFPLSLAIATSAAFPVAFGPAAIAAPAGCDGAGSVYWHLSDGGVIENLGLETLEEAALRALHSPSPPTRVLVVSIDAQALPDPDASFAESNLRVWTKAPERIVEVAMARGRAYHDLAWAEVRANAGAPFETVSVRYTEAALTAWPASCGRAAGDAAEIAAQLEGVSTSLRISECNADLLEAAAHQLVHATLNARADALAAQGFMLRTVAPHAPGAALVN
jgi:predicted acylesterase/phospholipase RssA